MLGRASAARAEASVAGSVPGGLHARAGEALHGVDRRCRARRSRRGRARRRCRTAPRRCARPARAGSATVDTVTVARGSAACAGGVGDRSRRCPVVVVGAAQAERQMQVQRHEDHDEDRDHAGEEHADAGEPAARRRGAAAPVARCRRRSVGVSGFVVAHAARRPRGAPRAPGGLGDPRGAARDAGGRRSRGLEFCGVAQYPARIGSCPRIGVKRWHAPRSSLRRICGRYTNTAEPGRARAALRRRDPVQRGIAPLQHRADGDDRRGRARRGRRAGGPPDALGTDPAVGEGREDRLTR